VTIQVSIDRLFYVPLTITSQWIIDVPHTHTHTERWCGVWDRYSFWSQCSGVCATRIVDHSRKRSRTSGRGSAAHRRCCVPSFVPLCLSVLLFWSAPASELLISYIFTSLPPRVASLCLFPSTTHRYQNSHGCFWKWNSIVDLGRRGNAFLRVNFTTNMNTQLMTHISTN
jgi:hypothetical protein